MKNEYRVVWTREGGRQHQARYATLRGAQQKALRLGPEPWLAALERRQRDPDAYFCCSGYECGCDGLTVRENWRQFMAKHPPIVDGPRIESRHVGTWAPERCAEGGLTAPKVPGRPCEHGVPLLGHCEICDGSLKTQSSQGSV